MDKQYCLEKAIEIAKAYAGGSTNTNARDVDVVLRDIYNMLKKLSEDVEG